MARKVPRKQSQRHPAGKRRTRRAQPRTIADSLVESKRKGQTPPESQAWFKAMTDNAPALVWMSGLDKLCTYFNQGWLNYTGRTMEQELGNGWTEGVHPEEFDRRLKTYVEAFDRREPFRTEYRLRKADGQYGWVLDNGTPHVLPNGEFAGYIGSCIEITEQKHAEEEVRSTNALISSILENLPDMIFVKDAKDLRFVRFNQAGENLLGYSRQEMLGKSDYDFFPKEEADFFTAKDREVLASVTLQDVPEEPIQTREKGRRILHTKKVPILDETGRPQYLLGISEDITDRKRAQEALRESEERFRTLAGHAPVGLFLTDPQGDGIYLNQRWCELAGLRPEQATGQGWVQAIHPEDRARVKDEWYQAVRESRAFHSEYRFRTPTGKVSWTIGDAIALRDPSGRITGYLGSVTDITDRKRTEEALAASEKRLRTVLEAEPECVKLLAPDCTLLEMNPAGLAMIEAGDLQEVLGKSVCPLVVAEYRDAFVSLNQRACQGESGELEYEIVGLKGGRRWVDLHAVPFCNDANGIIGSLGIARDVTERKRLQQAHERGRALLQSFVQHTPAAVAMLDKELRYLAVSKRWLQDYQLGDRDIVGLHHYDVFPEIRQLQDWQEIHQRCLAGAIERRDVDRFTRADGRLDWLRWEIRPWHDEAGQIGGIMMFTEVITERKRLEEQLLQSQKMEGIGRLAGGVAHDFNNLLTVIIGYAEFLLAQGALQPPLHRSALEIKNAAERAASLTQQLLTFSRRQVLQPRELDLNLLVADLSAMLRRVIGEDIRLNTDLDAAIGLIQADPTQIEQVLMNLVVNARDAMPEGGALTIETASVASRKSGQAGPWVRLTVRDTGQGMKAETLAHIFEPFFTTKEIGKGTGLGLATAYGTVTQSGGTIEAHSAPGQGATFVIHLPQVAAARAAVQSPPAMAPPAGGSETILLVEDEPIVREFMEKLLGAHGYHVLNAGNAQDALSLLQAHPGPLHLLLSDVVMPGARGHHLADRVVAARPKTRVLLMSGYTDDATLKEQIGAFGPAFIGKPFLPDELLRKVRAVLDAPDSGNVK